MGSTIILKGSRVAEVDAKCISEGIDSKWLMENAGNRVSDVIAGDFLFPAQSKQIKGVVICGSGNNGGDGFVAAMGLIKIGMFIDIFHTSPVEKFSPDSKYFFDKLSGIKNLTIQYLDFSSEKLKKEFSEKLEKSDFVLDAIFGTGLHNDCIRGQAREIIDTINSIKFKRKKTH